MSKAQDIENSILALITAEALKPGDRIPSERDLGERWDVNRLTVRRAVRGLIDKHVLVGLGTGGTRIAPPRIERPMDRPRAMGMERIISIAGAQAQNRLLHFSTERAQPDIASIMGLDSNVETISVRRLWLASATPFCVETSRLPADLVPALSADDLVGGQSLYELLRIRYGLRLVSIERQIEIIRPSAADRELLGLERGIGALQLTLTLRSDTGRVVEYMHSINHPDLVSFRNRTELTQE